MRLSQCTQGRDNNFNLIRIVAAFAVLVTHSFYLTGNPQPFLKTLGMTLGTWALDIFFLISGFLVTSSLLTRQSTVEFLWARILRIYPALFLMVFLTVFLLGSSFTELPLATYFSLSETYVYLAYNTSLFVDIAHFLPGVFNGMLDQMVNGSIWSLQIEVRLYALLALLWLFLRMKGQDRIILFKVIVVAWASAAVVLLFADHFYLPNADSLIRANFRHAPLFLVGAAFYILRNYVVLSPWVFFTLVTGLLASTTNKDLFLVAYVFSIGYIVFFLAYVPSSLLRRYNKLGDYSYGLYLYAWPVQQSVVAMMPGTSAGKMIVISGAISFVLAFLSWHIVERRSLNLKQHFADRTRAMFAKLSQSAPTN
jgi:peptidoglycan/LPS O-acetylase OafA/YrhL